MSGDDVRILDEMLCENARVPVFEDPNRRKAVLTEAGNPKSRAQIDFQGGPRRTQTGRLRVDRDLEKSNIRRLYRDEGDHGPSREDRPPAFGSQMCHGLLQGNWPNVLADKRFPGQDGGSLRLLRAYEQ